MKQNGTIESCRYYPSPNPHILLSEITYWSEGLRVKGLLARPRKVAHYEGILYLRGGIQRVGMVRPARIAQIAMQGFVVFAPYYRGNKGGEGRDEFAGEDRYDAVHAVEVLKQFCVPERVHVFAFSRGGLMALWTGILRQDITSIVTWAGVSDLTYTYYEREDMRRMLKRVIGGSPSKVPEKYVERTPLGKIANMEAAVLIIHGKQDQNVDIEHAKKLEDALMVEGKNVTTWYYETYTHFFPPLVNAQIVRDLCVWMKCQ